MDIIAHIIQFYIHLIFSLVPYLISGVAVYFYFIHQQWKQDMKDYNDAVDGYVRQFGGTREDAMKAITYDPL